MRVWYECCKVCHRRQSAGRSWQQSAGSASLRETVTQWINEEKLMNINLCHRFTPEGRIILNSVLRIRNQIGGIQHKNAVVLSSLFPSVSNQQTSGLGSPETQSMKTRPSVQVSNQEVLIAAQRLKLFSVDDPDFRFLFLVWNIQESHEM